MELEQQLDSTLSAIAAEHDFELAAMPEGRVLILNEIEECILSPDEAGARIVLWTPLVAFSEENRERVFEAALTLGSGGASVALHDDAPVLVLLAQIAPDSVNKQDLSRILMRFVDTAHHARDELGARAGADPLPDDWRSDSEVILWG